MKDNTTLGLMLTALILALFAPGCAWFDKNADNIGSGIKSAAYITTLVYLSEKPDKTAVFVHVKNALDQIIENENWDPLVVHAALLQLQDEVKEFRGERAALIFAGTAMVWVEFGESAEVLEADRVRIVAAAARDGIKLALSALEARR